MSWWISINRMWFGPMVTRDLIPTGTALNSSHGSTTTGECASSIFISQASCCLLNIQYLLNIHWSGMAAIVVINSKFLKCHLKAKLRTPAYSQRGYWIFISQAVKLYQFIIWISLVTGIQIFNNLIIDGACWILNKCVVTISWIFVNVWSLL